MGCCSPNIDTPDYAGASWDAALADIRTLPKRKAIEAAAQRGERVTIDGQTYDFTGLGDALIMLRLHYGSSEALAAGSRISEYMRDRSYTASVELARERGAFPLFNADLYLSGTSFAARLPDEIKALVRKHGIRNSHLLSIAPTGTISLAFADNA